VSASRFILRASSIAASKALSPAGNDEALGDDEASEDDEALEDDEAPGDPEPVPPDEELSAAGLLARWGYGL
jgi:hypothetical protein